MNKFRIVLWFVGSFLSNSLAAFPINLSTSKFYVREGFQVERTKNKPEDCEVCKVVSFTDESFKSIRIKKVFPEKYEAANKNISLEERVARQNRKSKI